MVMQATMVGVLLASLGAAGLMGRSRTQRWAVALNPTPHLTERLSMKLPKGWHVDQTPEGAVPLVVTATQREGGEAVRVLAVTEVPTDAANGEALLAAYLSRTPGGATAQRPFNFLGRPGLLVDFVLLSEADAENPLAPAVARPQCYAATVVQDPAGSGSRLGVIVALLDGPGGPSNERVVREVAGGLSLRAKRAAER